MTASHSPTRPLLDRAGAQAHRLVRGTGLASLVAYRLDPNRAVEVLAHGLTQDGTLVVGLVEGFLPEGSHEVRLDVRREADEAQVRITAASLHLLGVLHWLTPEESERLLDDSRLPETMSLLAGAPGVRWARVATERLVLHDASGVTPFDYQRAIVERAVFPAIAQELAAHDIVSRVGESALRAICQAVVAGTLPGVVQSDRPSANSCGHAVDRIFCVDVDGLGVNLMQVGRERTSVVFVPFPAQVGDLDSLAVQVTALADLARADGRRQRG